MAGAKTAARRKKIQAMAATPALLQRLDVFSNQTNDTVSLLGGTVRVLYWESILSDRSRSSPVLETYNTCGFLEMDLKDHLKEEMRVNLGTGSYSFRGGWGFDDMLFDDAIAVPEMAMEDGAMEMDSSPSTGSDKASSNSATLSLSAKLCVLILLFQDNIMA